MWLRKKLYLSNKYRHKHSSNNWEDNHLPLYKFRPPQGRPKGLKRDSLLLAVAEPEHSHWVGVTGAAWKTDAAETEQPVWISPRPATAPPVASGATKLAH